MKDQWQKKKHIVQNIVQLKLRSLAREQVKLIKYLYPG